MEWKGLRMPLFMLLRCVLRFFIVVPFLYVVVILVLLRCVFRFFIVVPFLYVVTILELFRRYFLLL